ncbi:MAG: metallophosphoesterase [Acidobacteria bacterium]|nr:metallophosphoesterase [Acidobacteriota bacterium]
MHRRFRNRHRSPSRARTAALLTGIGTGLGALLIAGVAGAGTAAGSSQSPGAAGAPAGSSVRFLVRGDWGTGSTAQADIARRMCASNATKPASFILTTGDNFYSPDGTATRDTFDRPEACLIASGLPWRATWGNHDLGGTSTATRLGSPKRWYSFAQGPLRVIVLDGNQPSSPAQLAFLKRTLERAKEPVRIVSIHQPVYTAGLHEPSTTEQRLMVPLFRKHGVSLVLSGHNHSYERIVTGGITYIVSGGGGAQLYPCVRVPAGLAKCTAEHNFLEVDASAAAIAVRAVRRDGSTLESVSVPVRGPSGA